MSYIGANKIGGMYLGSTTIAKAYLGNELVYQKSGVTPSLPYDAEIEYLQSSGTQYIQLNKVPDANTGICVELTKTTTSDTYFCGLRDTGGNTRWCIGTALENCYYGYGGFGGQKPIGHGIAKLNYLNSGTFEVKDEDESSYTVTSLPALGFTPQNQIRLFGSSGMNAFYSKWTGRIHSVKVSHGSDIIFDLIPVRVGSTGYMYDKISGTLFGNDGSGNFVLGNDIT